MRTRSLNKLLTDFGVGANMKSKKFSISTDKDGASDRTKIAILQAVGGQDMVDLVEMVEKVQLEAVVSDLGNWTVALAPKPLTISVARKIKQCPG